MTVQNIKEENKPASKIILVNPACKLQTFRVGHENNIIVIVDDFLSDPDSFVEQESRSSNFLEEADNYYPGVRADISSDYASYLRAFFMDNIAAIFGAFDSGSWSVQSKLCLANKAPTDLSPIQSIPREAITTGMPKSGYIMGDTELFKKVGKVDCKYNRIIFYKSNLLHAGDIDAKTESSQGYVSKQGCLNALKVVKALMQDADLVEL